VRSRRALRPPASAPRGVFRVRDSHDPAETIAEFLALWQRLRSESAEPGTVVVVEGDRDRTALRRLGIDGVIVTVHRGRTLSGTAHALVGSGRRVIVLTDWDPEGGTLARRLREFLEAERLSLDLEYRRRLARVVRGELVHVEGLYGWARRLAERTGHPLEELLDGALREAPGPTE
jgi:5S rRNA maturation endonuclease (ribonuclease M5)